MSYNSEYISNIEIDGADNLVFTLRDEMSWNGKIDEKQHLSVIQDKINACLAYIQTRTFKMDFPDIEIKNAIIEIKFKDMYTEHCKRYLQLVHTQLMEYGIRLDIYVDKK